MNARADGRDREGQAVVQLGHRHERDLLARRRRGLEVRGERRGQQEQDLDEREQDRAEQQDGSPRRGVGMACQEGGREEDRGDRREDLEPVEDGVGERRDLGRVRVDDEPDEVHEGEQDEDPGERVEAADRERAARDARLGGLVVHPGRVAVGRRHVKPDRARSDVRAGAGRPARGRRGVPARSPRPRGRRVPGSTGRRARRRGRRSGRMRRRRPGTQRGPAADRASGPPEARRRPRRGARGPRVPGPRTAAADHRPDR